MTSILDFIYIVVNSISISYVANHSIQIIAIATILAIMASLSRSRDIINLTILGILWVLLILISLRSNPLYLLPLILYMVHSCLWLIDDNKSDELEQALLLCIFMGLWIACLASTEYYQNAAQHCLTSHKYILLAYLGLELQAIPIYILVGNQWRKDVLNTEGALKTVIMGAIGSGFMLLGLSYMSTSCITGYHGINTLDIMGQVMFAVGLAFKLSLVPCHLWIIDVYQVFSYRMISVFAILPKVAAMFCVIHIGFHKPLIGIIIGLFGFASIVFGSIALIVQRTIKSFLAYSSISNIGYLTCITILYISLLQSDSSVTNFNIKIFYQFLSIYAISYLSSILPITTILNVIENRSNKLSKLSGFGRYNPILGIILSIALFSLAGLPITTGFMYKAMILSKLSNDGYIWLAILIAICSVISLYAYLKIIKIMYFEDNIESNIVICKCSNAVFTILIIMSLITMMTPIGVLYYLP